MAILYRYTIDGVIITEPENIQGWDKLVTTIKRDSSTLKGLLVTQDVELVFVGSMFDYFKNKYFNESICQDVPVLVEQSFDEGNNFTFIHRGKVFVSDLKIDLLKGVVTVKVQDDSFYARINNNKNIQTSILAGSTKNGIAIPACNFYKTSMFVPATGVLVPDGTPAGTRNAFKVIDVMRYLVRFMSDNEVEFESDFLDDDLQLMITQGFSIRVDGIVTPMWEVSYQQMFDNIRKCRDIGWTIEYPTDTTTKPVLRLELKSYFFTETDSLIFADPEKIKTSVKTDEIYAVIRAGSQIIADFPYCQYPEDIRFNGFKEETFYPLGQCNLDAELNLVKSFVVSSNAIEDALVHGSDSYDDDLFLIHVENIDDGAQTADAVGSNPFGTTPPQFYNMELINSNVLESFYGTIQGGLVAGFINFSTNDFLATKTVEEVYGDDTVPAIPLDPGLLIVDPISFQTEVDPGGNFNLGTNEYTAPQDGFYTFNLYILAVVQGYISGNAVQAQFGFNVNGTQTFVGSPVNYADGTYPITATINVFLNSGDTIAPIVSLASFGIFNTALHQRFRMKADSKFSCTSSPDTGGIVAEYNAADLRNILLEFEYPISATDFQTLLQNTRSKFKVELSVINENYFGWIEQVTYNHKTTNAKVILKASINSIGGTLEQSDFSYGYRFTFDMLDAADTIDSFTYNSGGSTTACAAIPLNDSAAAILLAIETCLGASGITFDSVTVNKTQLIGALYSFIITIFNPDTDITIIDISGTTYNSVVTYV